MIEFVGIALPSPLVPLAADWLRNEGVLKEMLPDRGDALTKGCGTCREFVPRKPSKQAKKKVL